MEEEKSSKEKNIRKRDSIKHVFLFALLLSGAVTSIIFIIFVIAEIWLKDPLLLLAEEGKLISIHGALLNMIIYLFLAMFFLLYVPLKSGILKFPISRKSWIILAILLTYLFSSVSLAFFLKFSTEMIDYGEFLTDIYPEGPRSQIEEVSRTNKCSFMSRTNKCSFNFKESFFDAVSGFTTTGLTAFRKTDFYVEGKEIHKIDLQPKVIHIVRAAYLWVGGLGIMFFYLYFSPVPSLMVSIGYEIPAERTLPKFIRLEGLSFSLVYLIITCIGIFLLYSSISDTCSSEEIDDNETIATYSVVLSFSSISTGGFSPASVPIDKLEITKYEVEKAEKASARDKRLYPDDKKKIHDDIIEQENGEKLSPHNCGMINDRDLIIIMGLMLAGAMPIFSLHRPWKFFRRWIIFVLFLVPICGYVILFYSEDRQTSFYRVFDAASAFTTTGLYTSQFENDFNEFLEIDYADRSDINTVEKIYGYRFRSIYIIMLMFVGGAAYSTAGGWGFFNLLCIAYALYLTLTGKLEKVLIKYIRGLVLSLLIFSLFFAVGTYFCYRSELFGEFSPDSEPAAVADCIMNSAFYEISALSTVGLMPDSMVRDTGIYEHNWAYGMLVISMLFGRLYYMLFPFLVSFIDTREGV